MLRFRPRTRPAEPWSGADLLAVAQVVDDALRQGNFLGAPELALTWPPARGETIPWEVFHGRLLDPAHTRLQQSFLSWRVLAQDQPLLSVKLDVQARRLHVTRGFACHVWEGYDKGGGVIESRETIKWTNELVATIYLDRFADLDEVRDELMCTLWQAVVGTSRLPLTSVEAPLPAFVLGQLHYVYRSDSGEQAIESWEAVLAAGLRATLSWREVVKLVEFALRRVGAGELPRLTEVFRAAWPAEVHSWPRLLRALFNDVSLSPYTGFVENTLAWVDLMTRQKLLTNAEHVDFLSHLLRQLGRHLTAYDLVTFHLRGANYPDALLLDAVLKAFLKAVDDWPELCAGDDPAARMRRRALRQGCLLRRHYEGHLVPDAPTSPGENARVMPASFPRIAEAQLAQPQRRRRKLFASDPLERLLSEHARQVFAQSLNDLQEPAERAELGIGLFIDRPLGYAKAPAEPDQTPLLAHEALSPSVARRRWGELQRLAEELHVPCAAALTELFEPGSWPAGLPHRALAECPRPTAALTDVRRVADDFVIVRTLPGSLRACRELFDWRALLERFRLRFLVDGLCGWCVQALDKEGRPVLALADAGGRRRLEMRVEVSHGYASRAGVELPVAGLIVLLVVEDTDDPNMLQEHDLTASPCIVRAGSVNDG